MKKYSIAIFVCLFFGIINAQPPTNPGPISGGLIFLLLAGIILGMFSLKDKNKRS